MRTILLVDDEEHIHYSFRKILGPEERLLSARSGEEALARLREDGVDLIIMDIRMPGMDGLQVMREIRAMDARIPVIVMTAFGTDQTAIEAMKLGAYDYLLKPFDIPKMQSLVEEALETSKRMKRAVRVPSLGERGEEGAETLLGVSPIMQEVYKEIGRVAERDVTVLLRGESGTGKELVARAIYQHSRRSQQPFIAVNCAAIPDTLLESELFGYERGAFTGATERRVGRFEQASGGTIFLDEIGDMSNSTQAKLLRVIQEGEFSRLGGREVLRTNIRLIVATNQNLEQAMTEGRFREDLYYRLNVVTIWLPPLRERAEDIPLLARYFLDRFSRELDRGVRDLHPEALRKLELHPWPGNVRELENCIKRAVILSRGPLLLPEDIRLGPEGETPGEVPADDEATIDRLLDTLMRSPGRGRLLPQVERLLIAKALEWAGGNQVRAARLLGISRNTLRSRMAKYDIQMKLSVRKGSSKTPPASG